MTPKSRPHATSSSDVAEFAMAEVARGPASPDVSMITAKAPMKKKEFVELAVERAGIRRADAKTAIEAALSIMAEALGSGQDLVLPPLGRMKVAREKSGKNGRQLVIKLMLPEAGDSTTEGLAETED